MQLKMQSEIGQLLKPFWTPRRGKSHEGVFDIFDGLSAEGLSVDTGWIVSSFSGPQFFHVICVCHPFSFPRGSMTQERSPLVFMFF